MCFVWHHLLLRHLDLKLLNQYEKSEKQTKKKEHDNQSPFSLQLHWPSLFSISSWSQFSTSRSLSMRLSALKQHPGGHKSEHRQKSMAWVSEADLLVSELPDIYHKCNLAQPHCWNTPTAHIVSRRNGVFSFVPEISIEKWSHWIVNLIRLKVATSADPVTFPPIKIQFSTISLFQSGGPLLLGAAWPWKHRQHPWVQNCDFYAFFWAITSLGIVLSIHNADLHKW